MEVIDSGSDIAMQLQELKYWKQNLKSNEVILSVDFSHNYDNK